MYNCYADRQIAQISIGLARYGYEFYRVRLKCLIKTRAWIFYSNPYVLSVFSGWSISVNSFWKLYSKDTSKAWTWNFWVQFFITKGPHLYCPWNDYSRYEYVQNWCWCCPDYVVWTTLTPCKKGSKRFNFGFWGRSPVRSPF